MADWLNLLQICKSSLQGGMVSNAFIVLVGAACIQDLVPSGSLTILPLQFVNPLSQRAA